MIDPSRTVEDVSLALRNVPFPATKDALSACCGDTPVHGVREGGPVPLADLVAPLPEAAFASPEQLTQAILTRWREGGDGRFRFVGEERG